MILCFNVSKFVLSLVGVFSPCSLPPNNDELGLVARWDRKANSIRMHNRGFWVHVVCGTKIPHIPPNGCYNRRIISLGQSSRPYKNTPTPYIASVSALPFPSPTDQCWQRNWVGRNLISVHNTQHWVVEGSGRVWGVKLPLAKRHRKLFVWGIIVPMNWSKIVPFKLNTTVCVSFAF
jgi:hypothetical protein